MHTPTIVTAPGTSFLGLADVKAHLRVDFDLDDTLIQSYMEAAVDYLDGYSGVLGRCLINQVWRQDYSRWQAILRLPFPDVSSVSVKYFDTANTQQTVATDQYELLADACGSYVDFLPAFTSPALYASRSDAVQVALTAGYGSSGDDVPAAIVHAAKMLVAHWYENREATSSMQNLPIPLGVNALIQPYRRVGL